MPLKIILCLLILTTTTFAQPRPSATPAPTRKNFVHPQGFTFQYPADWKIENSDQGAQIVPSGVAANDQTENFRILTIAAPIEITDPRFPGEMDTLAAQIPGFTKVGAIQSYKTKTSSGLRGVWAGANLTTNQPVQMRLYATTLNSNAIVLFAAGTAAKLDARESKILEIATSITPSSNPAAASQTQSAVDRSPLAQQWMQRMNGKKLTSMSSYNSGGGSGGMSSRTDVYLMTNGTFQSRSSSSLTVNVDGANASSSGGNQAAGTWRIYVMNGQAIFETKYANGQIESSRLEDRNGQTFINGKRWFVTEQ